MPAWRFSLSKPVPGMFCCTHDKYKLARIVAWACWCIQHDASGKRKVGMGARGPCGIATLPLSPLLVCAFQKHHVGAFQLA